MPDPIFSIITPSNNMSWIRKAWPCIKAQTEQSWEWIILINNHVGLDVDRLASEIANEELERNIAEFSKQDSRIHVIRENLPPKVGLLKNRACSFATGLYGVEFDHDDELSVNCLEELRIGFESADKPVFVFSDCASVREDNKPYTYNSFYGWTYHKDIFKGHDRDEEMVVPDHPLLLPQNVATIYFAPNHVRAWRMDVYQAIGGHNAEMTICDDQDLMCRLYQRGRFHYIPKLLYRYLVHSTNTWTKHQDEITKTNLEVYDRHVHQMALIASMSNGLSAIDIGGGIDSPPGWISVDVHSAMVNADLNEKWPFQDGSVGAIRAQDILEHLKNPVHVMNEAFRVLCHGGIFLIEVPSTDGRGAFQDPSHISFWNSNSFWYYTKAATQRYIKHLGVNCRFMPVRMENYYPSEWHKSHNIVYVKAHLVAIKDGPRIHGPLEI
jgi:hypothetical protein